MKKINTPLNFLKLIMLVVCDDCVLSAHISPVTEYGHNICSNNDNAEVQFDKTKS